MPDEHTLALRRHISRRSQLVRQRTRLKNEIHAVLAAHLIERCPATDLFGKKGRAWLGVQPRPLDDRLGVEQRLRELDCLGKELREVEQALAQATIDGARLRMMLKITGVNTTVAIGLLSAIGDIERFPNPVKLVSYFGLNPSVYQSGPTPAKHDHITKRGWAMPVEAAWAAVCVLPARARSPRSANCRCRDRSQTRGDRMVCADTRRAVRVGPSRVNRAQTARAGTAGWNAGTAWLAQRFALPPSRNEPWLSSLSKPIKDCLTGGSSRAPNQTARRYGSRKRGHSERASTAWGLVYFIRRVDYLAHARRKPEEWDDAVPVVAPRVIDGQEFLAPGTRCTRMEFGLSTFRAGCGIDRFDRRGQSSAVLPTGVVQAVADQMDVRVCSVVTGNTAARASGMPFRPSVTAIRMS